jgi:hypothetical protein
MDIRYYAVQFWSSNHQCTVGDPNKVTGRMSIACTLRLFRTYCERSCWIGNNAVNRKSVTKREARTLHYGMNVEEYNDMVRFLECTEVH